VPTSSLEAVVFEKELPSIEPKSSLAQQSQVDSQEFTREKNKVESHLGKIPMEVNASVLKWIHYFQGRGRRHMVRYLERSSRYIPYMKSKLKENGVPEELVYIALIESGFNSRAHSRASAVGYWQFIRGTGKRYGLKINSYIDERRDFVRSTEAAALYMKALYNLFGNWYLAMASYNAGENRIKRAVMKNYTRDFWELARKRQLPKETINYIPKYLAATLIGTNPEKYGFININYSPGLSFERVELTSGISLKKLAREIQVSYKDLRRLNPAIKRNYVPFYGRGRSYVNVPPHFLEVTKAALSRVKARTPRSLYLASSTYRIRRGDNLTKIAKRFGTTIGRLRRLNKFSRRSLLRVGRKIKIPEYAVARLATRSKNRFNRRIFTKQGMKYHTVRRGENLSVIARRYGISIALLKRQNNIGRRALIRVGDRLKVGHTPSSQKSYRRKSSKKIYVVRRGDNLTRIAVKYGVSVSQLVSKNSLKRRSKLFVGKRLLIPTSSYQ